MEILLAPLKDLTGTESPRTPRRVPGKVLLEKQQSSSLNLKILSAQMKAAEAKMAQVIVAGTERKLDCVGMDGHENPEHGISVENLPDHEFEFDDGDSSGEEITIEDTDWRAYTNVRRDGIILENKRSFRVKSLIKFMRQQEEQAHCVFEQLANQDTKDVEKMFDTAFEGSWRSKIRAAVKFNKLGKRKKQKNAKKKFESAEERFLKNTEIRQERMERQLMSQEDSDAPNVKVSKFNPDCKPLYPPVDEQNRKEKIKSKTTNLARYALQPSSFLVGYSLLVLNLVDWTLNVINEYGGVKSHKKYPFEEICASECSVNDTVALYHKGAYITLANSSVWLEIGRTFECETIKHGKGTHKGKTIGFWAGALTDDKGLPNTQVIETSQNCSFDKNDFLFDVFEKFSQNNSTTKEMLGSFQEWHDEQQLLSPFLTGITTIKYSIPLENEPIDTGQSVSQETEIQHISDAWESFKTEDHFDQELCSWGSLNSKETVHSIENWNCTFGDQPAESKKIHCAENLPSNGVEISGRPWTGPTKAHFIGETTQKLSSKSNIDLSGSEQPSPGPSLSSSLHLASCSNCKRFNSLIVSTKELMPSDPGITYDAPPINVSKTAALSQAILMKSPRTSHKQHPMKGTTGGTCNASDPRRKRCPHRRKKESKKILPQLHPAFVTLPRSVQGIHRTENTFAKQLVHGRPAQEESQGNSELNQKSRENPVDCRTPLKGSPLLNSRNPKVLPNLPSTDSSTPKTHTNTHSDSKKINEKPPHPHPPPSPSPRKVSSSMKSRPKDNARIKSGNNFSKLPFVSCPKEIPSAKNESLLSNISQPLSLMVDYHLQKNAKKFVPGSHHSQKPALGTRKLDSRTEDSSPKVPNSRHPGSQVSPLVSRTQRTETKAPVSSDRSCQKNTRNAEVFDLQNKASPIKTPASSKSAQTQSKVCQQNRNVKKLVLDAKAFEESSELP